jgi:hypothetical protein
MTIENDGHFIKILYDGKLVLRVTLSEWSRALATARRAA